MKKFTILTIFVFLSFLVWAQAPNKFSYQSVIRNSNGQVVSEANVSVRISILQGSSNGTVVYQETHHLTTNINGLVSLEIGNGTVVQGNFATINWSQGAFFIKTETDPLGGTNYTISATSQMLSVPYALYAEKSGTPGPKGDKGDVGLQGLKGDKGEQGEQGPKGDKGDQGIQGLKGDKGDAGNQGQKGDKGDQGEQGVKGDKGDQGIKGDKGDQGEQGPQGETGLQGTAGIGLNNQGTWTSGKTYHPSDYVFAPSSLNPSINTLWIVEAENEFVSTSEPAQDANNWVEFEAPQGPQGIQGIQGLKGDKGDQGIQGEKGELGLQGEQGPQGIQGEKGDKGDTGAQGIQGEKGEKGDQGIQGPQGEKGDKGDQGIQGTAGAGLNNRGNWVAGLFYYQNDYVFAPSSANPLVNSMWIFKQDASLSNIQPSSDANLWVEFVAPQGEKGDKGDQGIQGEVGPQGEQGLQGVQGEEGDKGEQGEQGPKGDTGLNGLSAYEVAQANGYVGTELEWLASLQGEAGEKGETGNTGASAYESWLTLDHAGTEADFIASLKGEAGVDGRTILNGTTTPESAIGLEGDFYLNTTENKIFGPKTAQGWGEGVLLGSKVQDGNDYGDILFWNGEVWEPVSAGSPGQMLQLSAEGKPMWAGNTFPVIATASASNVTATMVTLEGEVTGTGGAAVTERGFVYGYSSKPTIADNKATVGSGTGSFNYELDISAMPGVTTVYVRAYATSSVGTGYGAETTFVTLPGLPNLSMNDVSNITSATATFSAEVIGDGGADVTVRGFVYSTANSSPSLADNLGNLSMGIGTGTFTNNFNISGFVGGLTIYVRAYATNSQGTTYSSVKSFNVPPKAPNVGWTQVLANVTATTASGIGNVIFENGANVTERGICYSTSANPTVNDSKISFGSGTGTFNASLTNLTPSTSYYARVYATNAAGTSYSSLTSQITTLDTVPSVSTAAITFFGETGFQLNGEATSENGSAITARGFILSINNSNPYHGTPGVEVFNSGSGLGSFNSTGNYGGFPSGTILYARAWAQNTEGYAYGSVVQYTVYKKPVLSNTNVNNITKTSADAYSSVSDNGGYTVTQRGFVYRINDGGPNPTLENATVVYVGSGNGNFNVTLTGLQAGVNYIVRAFATNSLGTSYTSNAGFFTPIEVGDTGPAGGIVFYDKGNYNGGWRYLEAAPVEAETVLSWGCENVAVSSTSTGVSQGEENTQQIIWNGCVSPAANYCYNLNLNGFDDWFLPSKEEINYMYSNLKLNGLGGFSEAGYWSSSQSSETHSWHVNMINNNGLMTVKTTQLKIRPVRGF